MITNVSDLEPLFGRFDPGLILVGPLSSTYHYFVIAGNGSRVYEIVDLGSREVEADAERQRAEFIEKLESRLEFIGKLESHFAKVMAFSSYLEMAQAAHERWPNEETARVLAFAALAAKSEPMKVPGQRESIGDSSFAGVLRRDYGKQSSDAREPVDDANDIYAVSRGAPLRARDQGQPRLVVHPAPTLAPRSPPVVTPSQELGSDPAVTQRRRRSAPSRDEIARTDLKLESSVQRRRVPSLPVGGARTLSSIILRSCTVAGAIAAVASTIAVVAWLDHSLSVNRDKVPLPAAPAASPSVQHQQAKANEPTPQSEPTFVTVPPTPPSQPSQAAGDQLPPAPTASPSVQNQQAKANEPTPQSEPTFVTVPPTPPSQPSQAASDQLPAAPAASPSVQQQTKANEPTPQSEPTFVTVPPTPPPQPSQAAGDQLPAAPAASPSVQNQRAKANEPMRQSESTFATVPAAPPSQPSQAASDQAGAAPFSGPQSAPAQGSSTAMRPDAEEIAALVNRGSDFLKKGDYTSARLLLRRAAAAGSASAAFMLGATFDPLVIQQIGGIGIKPDIALARQWYEKAAELGSDAALQQLAKLAQTGK